MPRITRDSLLSHKAYLDQRNEWRQTVIPFKKLRTVLIGNNASLMFENELTVRYQLQEMIRVDKSMAADDLEHELAIYNELVPTRHCLKATLMFEFVDADVRATKLDQMLGVEHAIWMNVNHLGKRYATPNRMLGEPSGDRVSSVYFLSFQLEDADVANFIAGEPVALGIDHPAYNHSVDEISPQTQSVLIEDLKSSSQAS